MSNSVKIKEMPSSERPTEKLVLHGTQVLSNNELLAVILRNGTKDQNVLFMSTNIISILGGINNLLNCSLNDLIKIKGIGKAKAAQIMALGELCRRYRGYKSSNEYKILTPLDAVNLVMEEMRVLNQEYLKVIVLSAKKTVISIKDISIGGLKSSIVHPREVFAEAIKSGGDCILICHNHPSGDPTPSKNDINVTFRLKECGKLLGVEIVDHIIIGNRKYISLKEKGIV